MISETQGIGIIGLINGLYRNAKEGVRLDELNIDVQSFVEFFLFQEIFDNNGFAHSSTYLYRPTNGRITMGPVWDFDMFMTNADSIGFNTPELYDNVLFRYLMKNNDFSTAIKTRFFEVYEDVMPLVKSKVLELKNNPLLREAVLRDQKLYNTWGVKLPDLRAWQNDNIDDSIAGGDCA